MNADHRPFDQPTGAAADFAALARPSLGAFGPLVERMRSLHAALDLLGRAGDRDTAHAVLQLRKKLAALEPSVTMIGQVKAGKTSLVNAMVGWPGLLPADVNPWTSVVTSLHLSPRPPAQETRARFGFFSRDEWDRLVLNGGRVGELAGRAGAEAEVEKVRAQIAEMQEKSRRRLGRKFEMLLGQTHEYGHFDSALIERYVCLGDDLEDDDETSKSQGRFADITRSAELFLHAPALPLPLCIRDTPGVNDTFMVREQITIRSIRDSRICVVVLSAHQALSSIDMALIRLISNVRAREVVIFVNRIDELSDPAAQVPEIGDSIRATLAAHHGPAEARIVFGSAAWAHQALRKGDAETDADGTRALRGMAAAAPGPDGEAEGSAEQLWRLSGVPELFATLADRIAEGPGRETLDSVARSARNLAGGIRIATNVVALGRRPGARAKIDPQALAAGLGRIEAAATRAAERELARLDDDFTARVDQAHHGFLQRATATLVEHLDRYGDQQVWKYDPAGLRVLLRSAYQLYAKRTQDAAGKLYGAVAEEIGALYRAAHLVDDPAFRVEPPPPPRAAPPVLLGQTIALDMAGNWWSRWWRRRRGFGAYAQEFHDLIKAETDPIVAGLRQDHASAIRADVLATLDGFLKEQGTIIAGLSAAGARPESVARGAQDDRQAALRKAMVALDGFAA